MAGYRLPVFYWGSRLNIIYSGGMMILFNSITKIKLDKKFDVYTVNSVLQHCDIFDLDPFLVLAIIQKESKGNRFATRYESNFLKRYINPLTNAAILEKNPEMAKQGIPSQSTERRELATSWGLMQVMGQTAREYGFRGQYLSELTDTEQGIQYGCSYLASKIMNHATLEMAISAYNAGYASEKNKDYVDEVLKIKKELESL